MAAASDNPELYAALRDAGADEDASRAAAGGVENRIWGNVTRWVLLFFAGMATSGLILIAGLGARIDAVNARIDATNASIAMVNTRIDATNAGIAMVNTRIDATNARIDAVQAEVAKNGASIQALSVRMDNVERRLDGVEQRLGRVEQRLDRIELLLTQLVEQRTGQAAPAKPPIPGPETSAAPDSASPIPAAPKKSNS